MVMRAKRQRYKRIGTSSFPKTRYLCWRGLWANSSVLTSIQSLRRIPKVVIMPKFFWQESSVQSRGNAYLGTELGRSQSRLQMRKNKR